MSSRLDPTQAIEESKATGEIAETFADIRETMNIPLITSIWRCLAGVPDALPTCWAAIRPLMASDEIEHLLHQLETHVELPIPTPLTASDQNTAGITATDREPILNVIAAYNRSNCLNLIAITAFLRGPDASEPPFGSPPRKCSWLPLPRLCPPAEITPEHWALLKTTTTIGSAKNNPHIPTIWRHLLGWPRLVELIGTRYNTAEMQPVLITSVDQVTSWVENHAPSISHLANHAIEIPAEARTMLASYVGPQPSVARMATVGRSAAQWLRTSDWS